MAKNPIQKVLYEAIKQNKAEITHVEKPKRSRLEKVKNILFAGQKSRKAESRPSDDKVTEWPPKQQGLVRYLGRTQFGRYISNNFYPIKIILVLTLLLIVLIAIKIGQVRIEKRQKPDSIGTEGIIAAQDKENLLFEASENIFGQPEPVKEPAEQVEMEEKIPIDPVGNHLIVIMTYRNRRDLEPVKDFFAVNGVETYIEKRGEYYFLLTKDKYQSTELKGSDGYIAKQRIKKIGINYKSPTGYETFGSKPFQDVYGMKIK